MPEASFPIPLADLRPALLLLARNLVERRWHAKMDPSDLVQLTLLEAHRDAATFQGDSPAAQFAWLRQILRRNLQNAFRDWTRERRDVQRERSLSDLNASCERVDKWLADPSSNPVERAERHEMFTLLAKHLETLVTDQREALELRFFHGWKLEELATHLQRSYDAVAQLIQRGLRRLKELMPTDPPHSS